MTSQRRPRDPAEVLLRLRRDPRLQLVARIGLVGRGVFHLLLAVLTAALVVGPAGGEQTNVNGVLTALADREGGETVLVVAAVGFGAFGVMRLLGALTDRRHGRLRRATTAGQGTLYLGLAFVTSAFLAGRRGVGSEDEQQRTASQLLDLPGGRLILAGLGTVVLAVCLWQLVVTASGGFADSLDFGAADPSLRRLVLLTARVGIPARALAFLPIGVFLVVAAVADEPARAKGLDGFLLDLVDESWGKALVALVALGLVTFAVYSFLEARYRQVDAGV